MIAPIGTGVVERVIRVLLIEDNPADVDRIKEAGKRPSWRHDRRASGRA